MKVRRIVAVCHSGEVSGAEIALIRVLDEALKRGLEVVFCSASGPVVDALPEGVRHVVIPHLGLGSGSRVAGAAGLLARTAQAGRILRALTTSEDLVLANGLLVLPAVRAGRLDAHVSWLVHDVIVSRQWLAILSAVSGCLDTVVAVSDAAAAPLRARGLPVDVVHHGVQWPVAPRTAEPETPTIGMAALITPWKGHRDLLDAVAQMRHRNVVLELAGGFFPKDEQYRAALQDHARALGIEDRVRFLGKVNAIEQMRGWTIAVNASVEPEAGPLVALEALSVGVPMVATGHGGSVEILGRGGGILVAPHVPSALAAALDELLERPDERERLSIVGRALVAAEYRLDVQVPLMLDALLAGAK